MQRVQQNKKNMKITVVGTGYVGMSLAVLFAKNNDVTAFDLNKQKVDLINNKISPIKDYDVENFLQNKSLKLLATTNKDYAYKSADFIVVATPTNYDVITNSFDVSSIEKTIEDATLINPSAIIVIKSTIPIGYVQTARIKHKTNNIIFSPEFLREGNSLHDNLYPSRIVIGDESDKAKIFANLLTKAAIKKDIPVLFTGPNEAEAIKLYANSYLAMRVAYFNEIDSFCEIKNLNTKQIIDGVCLDTRIGNHYNNPSFGYGGYCLPKDTKQLLANYKNIPQIMISAIVSSNEKRLDHIADQIIKNKPKIVGIYRLIMKSNSDNFRESSTKSIIERIKNKGIQVLIYEPILKESHTKEFLECQIVNCLETFKEKSDLIVTNRLEDELNDVKDKIYTRDVYNNN